MPMLLPTLTALAFVLASAAPCSAGDDRADILTTVERFFAAMAAKDLAAARELVVGEGRFVALREEGGKTLLRVASNEELVASWATAPGQLLERFWDAEVRVHQGIATLWAPYDFHLDGQLSHCGVDAFDLVKVDGRWKIAGGVYSVVRTGCPPSPLPPPGEAPLPGAAPPS